MIWGKQTHQRLFSATIGEKEHISVLSIPHIPSTSFGDITPLHHPLYLQPNWKEKDATLSVVEVPEEVMEAMVLAHVEEMVAEVM